METPAPTAPPVEIGPMEAIDVLDPPLILVDMRVKGPHRTQLQAGDFLVLYDGRRYSLARLKEDVDPKQPFHLQNTYPLYFEQVPVLTNGLEKTLPLVPTAEPRPDPDGPETFFARLATRLGLRLEACETIELPRFSPREHPNPPMKVLRFAAW